ncbi:hypothetical protein FGO68_gene4345 [Halteria grandinella]|uniref:Uncharacterized protein n=1 Tax=Halteria grandinella TaxID=5974 RepID=A0A8J8NE75_HALGN|nr:hypothetical protein FGO68_gene4345 [Halteria grandinella]
MNNVIATSSSKGSNGGRQVTSRKNSVRQAAQFGCLQTSNKRQLEKQRMISDLERVACDPQHYADTEDEQYDEISAFTDKPMQMKGMSYIHTINRKKNAKRPLSSMNLDKQKLGKNSLKQRSSYADSRPEEALTTNESEKEELPKKTSPKNRLKHTTSTSSLKQDVLKKLLVRQLSASSRALLPQPSHLPPSTAQNTQRITQQQSTTNIRLNLETELKTQASKLALNEEIEQKQMLTVVGLNRYKRSAQVSQRDHDKENSRPHSYNMPTNDIFEKRDQESTKVILREIRTQIDSMISQQESLQPPPVQDASKLPNYDLATLNPNNSVVIDLHPLPLETLPPRSTLHNKSLESHHTPLTTSHASAFNLSHPDKQTIQQLTHRIKLITKKYHLAIEENEYLRTQLQGSEEIRKNQGELIRLMQSEQQMRMQEGLMGIKGKVRRGSQIVEAIRKSNCNSRQEVREEFIPSQYKIDNPKQASNMFEAIRPKVKKRPQTAQATNRAKHRQSQSGSISLGQTQTTKVLSRKRSNLGSMSLQQLKKMLQIGEKLQLR